MSWAAPFALVGLAVLPVVWFLHRRRRRPRQVGLPSLLFLRAEPAAAPARRQVLDPELWLSLAAVALLVAAAAGPFLTRRAEGRTVALVVSGGVPATARGYRDRVDALRARIQASLAPADRLVVHEEPRGATERTPRPRPEVLLATAHADVAAWRVVVSDAPAPDDTAGVTWVSVGVPDAFNVGIVAVSLTSGGAGYELFANVRGDDARPTSVRLVVRDRDAVLAEQRLEIAAGAHASHVFALGRIGLAFRVELALPDGATGTWADDLPADDGVDYERTPVLVHVSPSLPLALRHAVEDAFVATLGRRGTQETTRDPALLVASADAMSDLPKAPWRLVLHPAPAGGALRAETGVDRVRPDPLVRDLSTSGTDLVYAPAAAEEPAGGLTVLLWREAGGRRWPVVARADASVHFLPDPTRGRPAPAETPLWPLFLDDLLGEVAGHGEVGGAGYRHRGALDDASSALGRTASPWSVPDLTTLPPDVRPVIRSLRPFLAVGALLALLLLWFVRWGHPTARRGARRHAVPSAHGDPVPS